MTEIRKKLFSDLCYLISDGGVAQLGERLLCKQEVIGSIPFTSTIFLFLVAVFGRVHTIGMKLQIHGFRMGDVDVHDL